MNILNNQDTIYTRLYTTSQAQILKDITFFEALRRQATSSKVLDKKVT